MRLIGLILDSRSSLERVEGKTVNFMGGVLVVS